MFGSILKSIGRISPLKFSGGKISLGMPKVNLGDVLNIGLTAGTGNPFNIGAWSLKNAGANLGISELMKKGLSMETLPQWLGIANELSGALGGGKGAGQQSSAINGSPLGMQLALLQRLMPMVESDMAFQKEMQPQRQALAKQVISDLDPSLNPQRAAGLGNQAATDAMMGAERESSRLSTMGYSPALTESLRGAAVNEGNRAKNDYLERAMDPATTAEQRRAQLAVMDDSALSQNLDRALAILDSQRQGQLQERAYKSSQPSWQSIVAGLAGNYLGGMNGSDWDALFKRISGKPAGIQGIPYQNSGSTALGSLSNPAVMRSLLARLGYG